MDILRVVKAQFDQRYDFASSLSTLQLLTPASLTHVPYTPDMNASLIGLNANMSSYL